MSALRHGEFKAEPGMLRLPLARRIRLRSLFGRGRSYGSPRAVSRTDRLHAAYATLQKHDLCPFPAMDQALLPPAPRLRGLIRCGKGQVAERLDRTHASRSTYINRRRLEHRQK